MGPKTELGHICIFASRLLWGYFIDFFSVSKYQMQKWSAKGIKGSAVGKSWRKLHLGGFACPSLDSPIT